MVSVWFLWAEMKQFPVNEIKNTEPISRVKKVTHKPQPIKQKNEKPKKVKRTTPKKPREISLYSPEYL